MAMTPREVVSRAVRFQKPDRLPYALTEKYGTDFSGVGMDPSPERMGAAFEVMIMRPVRAVAFRRRERGGTS